MRDYSNYYSFTPKEKRKKSAEQTFNRAYLQGYGYEITVNEDKNIKKNVIILKHTVQMSQAQEERKLYIKNEDLENDFFQGDVITGYQENINNKGIKYMVMTTPSSDGVYSSFCKLRRVNSELSFITKEGKIYTEPCILTDQTLYTDGVYQDNLGKYSDDKRGMIIRCTEGTDKIRLNQRVMFNNNSIYYIAKIDDYTLRQKYDDGKYRGMYQCVLTRAEGIDLAKDNIDLGIADYYNYFPKNSTQEVSSNYITKTVNSQQYNDDIEGSDCIRIGRSEAYILYDNEAIWEATIPSVKIVKNSEGVKITCKREAKLIGETFTLSCYTKGRTIQKQIAIKG